MPISYAAMQVYHQYLTTYGNKRSSRYDTHDLKELQHLYSSIQLKNRFAPLYLTEPTTSEITYALSLKENAKSFHNAIDALSGDNEEQLFSVKTAYSSAPDLVSAVYEIPPSESKNHTVPTDTVPNQFHLHIQCFASPQKNQSSFLSADQPVMMPAGSYSFDILTNKLHYELQFNLNEGETHKQLQQKLMRLINNSDLGVHAELLSDEDRTALEITSDAYGLPFNGTEHFQISDDNTSHANGMVHYLGLNKSIVNAANATYTVDDTQYSSYTNTVSVYNAYVLTFHPDAAQTFSNDELAETDIEIGLYPDWESLSYNIEAFVKSYNTFMTCVCPAHPTEQLSSLKLNSDIQRILAQHEKSIEKYGILISEDSTLTFDSSIVPVDDTNHLNPEDLQNFGNHILHKLDSISLDPMEYVNRTICAYSNPAAAYVNPYVTSIYSGMLFNSYC